MNRILELLIGFWGQNKLLALSSLALTLLYYPLEIIAVSKLTSQLFILLNEGVQKHAKTIPFTVFLLFGIYIALEGVVAIKDYLDSTSIPRFEQYVRGEIIKPVLAKNLVNYDNVETAQLLQNMSKIPRTLSDIFERLNRFLIPFFVIGIFVSAYFAYLNWQLGLVSIICFFMYFLVFKEISTKQIAVSEEREEAENYFYDQIEDIVNNLFTVTVANSTKQETENIDNLTGMFNRVYQKEMLMSSRAKFYNGVLALSVLAALSFIILKLSFQGKMSQKNAVLAFGAIIFMSGHFRSLARRVAETMIEIGSLKVGGEYLEKVRRDTVPNGTRENFVNEGEVVFRNLSFKYPESGKAIIDGLNFKKSAGESLTILGPSGCGKSTLVKMLNGFYTPTNGSILIDGVDLRQADRLYLRRAVSYLPQNTRLFNRPILENMIYGTGKSSQDAINMLNSLGVSKIFKGVDLTRAAGRFGDKLSGGQKQVVHLVRICLSQPKMVILDEPSTGIDIKHRIYVKKVIQELSKRIPVILITHDSDMVIGKVLKLKKI